jgi:catechol-2,3-dioxygenase
MSLLLVSLDNVGDLVFASALAPALRERFTGASDHFVSEALYLRDPEGNEVIVTRTDDERQNKAFHGLTRALIVPRCSSRPS